jgi:hypothetical protein
MKRCAFAILVGLAVFARALSASAECAWVLWTAWDNQPQTVTATYGDRSACVKAIDAALIKWGSVSPTDGSTHKIDLSGLADGNAMFWAAKNGKVTTLGTYICLPDTMDPRGPKGSGR